METHCILKLTFPHRPDTATGFGWPFPILCSGDLVFVLLLSY